LGAVDDVGPVDEFIQGGVVIAEFFLGNRRNEERAGAVSGIEEIIAVALGAEVLGVGGT
jgi:hypothetical protein